MAKSSFSNPNGACVDVKKGVTGLVHVTDTKNPLAPGLWFTPEEWDAFLKGAALGEFDYVVLEREE